MLEIELKASRKRDKHWNAELYIKTESCILLLTCDSK